MRSGSRPCPLVTWSLRTWRTTIRRLRPHRRLRGRAARHGWRSGGSQRPWARLGVSRRRRISSSQGARGCWPAGGSSRARGCSRRASVSWGPPSLTHRATMTTSSRLRATRRQTPPHPPRKRWTRRWTSERWRWTHAAPYASACRCRTSSRGRSRTPSHRGGTPPRSRPTSVQPTSRCSRLAARPRALCRPPPTAASTWSAAAQRLRRGTRSWRARSRRCATGCRPWECASRRGAPLLPRRATVRYLALPKALPSPSGPRGVL
mmetsp:Transcript_36190/g.84769  ORF Transcript_36190/g.84769 Transcript_36190/m.84769 type:complete len:263 (-) Transcript_36190:493-1281(-)